MKPNANNFKVHDFKPGSNPDSQDEMKSPLVPELQAFAKNIWLVEGPNVRDMGIMFTTRMTVVKACQWLGVDRISCARTV